MTATQLSFSFPLDEKREFPIASRSDCQKGTLHPGFWENLATPTARPPETRVTPVQIESARYPEWFKIWPLMGAPMSALFVVSYEHRLAERIFTIRTSYLILEPETGRSAETRYFKHRYVPDG